jgi:diguanylate cyclase (GGDEF)-like protein/PAS domain S-box-containing protein
MQGTYDFWLVACSFVVAVVASFAALELAGRVVVSQGRATWAWVGGGSVALGIGIWSMHFIGMLAFHLPISLAYDAPITLLSILPAIFSAALVLGLVHRQGLSSVRLCVGAVVLGCGIAAMHYTGMAAIPIQPAVSYKPLVFTASVAVAIAVAFIALKLAFSLSGSVSRWKKFTAALVMAAGICAMHYTGMAAAIFSPDSFCAVAPGAVQNGWLASVIAFNTLVVLAVSVTIAFYDARFADRNARAARALRTANEELTARTRRAEQAESDLRESEARFRSLTELSSDWYWEQDQDFRFTRMSGGILHKLGWDPAIFVGKSRWDFPLLVDDETLSAHKALLAAHQPFHDFVYARPTPEGALTYISSSGIPLFDDAGAFRGYRGVGRDVTQHKREEEAIRRAREQLRLALIGSKLALFEWDIRADTVFLDERWAEMIGATPGPTQTTIAALAQAVHPDDRDKVQVAVLNVVKGLSAYYESEHRIQNAQGHYIWLQSHGKVVERDIQGTALRVSGTNADISHRKQAEQALQEAHLKLSSGVKALEQRNREMSLLAELSNFLISCVTVDEACSALPKYCETLFPATHGAVYLFRSSRDHLNPYASWGNTQGTLPPILPDDCWALRRGKPHTVLDMQRDSICNHVRLHEKIEPYLCIPLVVQSELLGLMWMALDVPAGQVADQAARLRDRQQLAVTLSEQIALSLSNIRLRENLRQQTIRDPLTGLYNRRFLEESLNREMARCKRKGTVFAVLMMDLDHFKRFNDTFGHDAGDSVLRSFSQALQENTREGDIACRFGGEEFVLVMPDTDLAGASTRAERILTAVRRLHVTYNDKLLGPITTSIGLAMYPQDGTTTKTIIRSVDRALYEAKGAGRDQLVLAAGH